MLDMLGNKDRDKGHYRCKSLGAPARLRNDLVAVFHQIPLQVRCAQAFRDATQVREENTGCADEATILLDLHGIPEPPKLSAVPQNFSLSGQRSKQRTDILRVLENPERLQNRIGLPSRP